MAGGGGVSFGDARDQDAAWVASPLQEEAGPQAGARRAGPRPAQAAPPEPGVLARARDAAGRQLAGHRADAARGVPVRARRDLRPRPVDRPRRAGGFGAGRRHRRGARPGPGGGAGGVLRLRRGAALAAAGVRRRRRRRHRRRATAPGRAPTVRIAIGALLLFVADVGILHLAYGRPALDGDLDALRNAGGALGAMVAGPLDAATGVVGAASSSARSRSSACCSCSASRSAWSSAPPPASGAAAKARERCSRADRRGRRHPRSTAADTAPAPFDYAATRTCPSPMPSPTSSPSRSPNRSPRRTDPVARRPSRSRPRSRTRAVSS